MDFDCILWNFDGTLWILLDFTGVSMKLHAFLWNINGFWCNFMDLRNFTEFWSNPMGCYGVVRNSDETSRILIEFNGTWMELHALWWNPLGIWWNVMDFTKLSGNCSAIVWILMERYGIPKELHGFQWNFCGMSRYFNVTSWILLHFVEF